MKKMLFTALMFFIISAPFLFGGCTSEKTGEGFAIYLTRDNIPVDKMEMLSRVAIADEPVISTQDIIAYTWATQEIRLTSEAYTRVTAFQVPTTGLSFVVCVDKSPVYWGAFWAGYSSQSFDGITIVTVPPLPEGENTIAISHGYPGSTFARGEDTRFRPDVKAALEKAGKLQ